MLISLLFLMQSLDVKTAPSNVTVRQLTYAQLDGTRNAATLVTAAAAASPPRPAILYLHWYEPPRPTSNRTEFLPEAIELADAGPISLLVIHRDERNCFRPREPPVTIFHGDTKTFAAPRLLLAHPCVDKSRVAIVGHDFAHVGHWRPRPIPGHAFVLGGTRSFLEWYHLHAEQSRGPRDAFGARLAPLESDRAPRKISPRPILLQFGPRIRS